VIIGLLIVYARDLVAIWPQAFPGYPELGTLLAALIYIGVLAAIYAGLRPILFTSGSEAEIIMLIQAILVIVALIIVARAGFIAYQGLTGWLTRFIASFRQQTLNGQTPQQPESIETE
jgi:hypothetical protein